MSHAHADNQHSGYTWSVKVDILDVGFVKPEATTASWVDEDIKRAQTERRNDVLYTCT